MAAVKAGKIRKHLMGNNSPIRYGTMEKREMKMCIRDRFQTGLKLKRHQGINTCKRLSAEKEMKEEEKHDCRNDKPLTGSTEDVYKRQVSD